MGCNSSPCGFVMHPATPLPISQCYIIIDPWWFNIITTFSPPTLAATSSPRELSLHPDTPPQISITSLYIIVQQLITESSIRFLCFVSSLALFWATVSTQAQRTQSETEDIFCVTRVAMQPHCYQNCLLPRLTVWTTLAFQQHGMQSDNDHDGKHTPYSTASLTVTNIATTLKSAHTSCTPIYTPHQCT